MRERQNKVLIFESRYICYDSGDAFLTKIADAFQKQGVLVDFCKVTNPEEEEDKLKNYIGKEYDAMFDLNSNLVFAYCEEEQDFLFNLIHAPFYDILVDHPIHLHERLNVPLRDYHVICIDRFHREYVKKNYPNIKSAEVIPFGAMCAENYEQTDILENHQDLFIESYLKRNWDLLLPITYIPDDYYLNMLKEKKLIHVQYAMDCYDLLASSEKMTLEEAVKMVYRDEEGAIEALGADNLMEVRLIDRYIRGRMRNQAVEEILKTGRQVHVLGANWNCYEGKITEYKKKHLILHKSETYLESLKEFTHSKVIFNMQPLFLNGPHDRVFNAMANGCVSLTDTCEMLEKEFSEGTHYVKYTRNQLEMLPDIIEGLFADENRMALIAWEGCQEVLKKHTWDERVKQFLKNT